MGKGRSPQYVLQGQLDAHMTLTLTSHHTNITPE